MAQVTLIDQLSVTTLYLELSVNNNSLSTATGFIVEHSNRHYLITNWHVLSGRNPETNQPMSPTAGIPDQVKIIHHNKNKLGTWVIGVEELIDSEGNQLWLEHPNKNLVDVAALPLSNIPEEAIIYPLDVSLAGTDIKAMPAMSVSILGFPFGFTSHGAYPIWKTGHIASDPDLDINGNPYFYIDATTREGMSGSPVLLRAFGGYNTKSGNYNMVTGAVNLFMGVYSGRLNDTAEIGKVWKPRVIHEILP